jgi:single-strand DNA-binding protein
MNSLCIIGRVGKGGGTLRNVRDRTVLSFSVAVNVGYGQNEQTLWFDCSLWGARAEKLAEYVRQGDQIGVTGELSTREHEGKTYLKIEARDITLIGGNREGEQPRRGGSDDARRYREGSEGGRTPASPPPMDDFEDSDIPF